MRLAEGKGIHLKVVESCSRCSGTLEEEHLAPLRRAESYRINRRYSGTRKEADNPLKERPGDLKQQSVWREQTLNHAKPPGGKCQSGSSRS